MARKGSGKSTASSSSAILGHLYAILEVAFKAAGAIFALISLFFIWGMTMGTLAGNSTPTPADYLKIAAYVYHACNALTICGVIVVLCASARFYAEEVTGYVLIILGALLRWAMPLATNETSPQMAPLVKHIMDQFGYVGTIALLVSMPFMLYNMWTLVRADKMLKARAAKCVTQKSDAETTVTGSGIGFNCWQMPFCREYMRQYCDAYKCRKSCWRLNSGCYCDEGMIVRALRAGSRSDSKLFDLFRSSSKQLSWVQKRRRCEQCIMYLEHQKLKYQLLSPIGFILPIALIWAYFEPVKNMLHGVLMYTYEFTNKVSVVIRVPEAGTQTLAQTLTTADTAETIFIVCFGLVMVAMTLRLMEYLIFKMRL